MPRKPRFYLPDIPAHIVQRGNCRQAVFFDDQDYVSYLKWLKEGALKYGCSIHAYVLMTNHVHLLMTPETSHSISKTIQYVGRNYVTYVNHVYGKSGTLWEGRHKGCVVANDNYFLRCMRYIELNPVRAGMVDSPDKYSWSSYHQNASGSFGKITTPHDLYMNLADTVEARGKSYRELFKSDLVVEQIKNIRETVQTGTPLGNDRFRKQVEDALKCKVGQARRGRPNKFAVKGY